MSTHLAKLFTQDDRAVAPIIGIILLFGIFFIGFAGYQAEYVPQQNAETEFQHYQDVQNDLTVVRNAISRAGQQNQNQFESVQLGTNYRQRILAINPPAPTGTLRTSDAYNIKIDPVNGGESREVETRFLEYRNGYNELNIEPIYYENSVLYLNSSESGQRVFFEDQNLVQDNGDTVVITALQREFSRSAVGRITVELYPTDGGNQLPTGDLEVTLPTQLPEPYWQGELAGEDPIIEGSYSYNERTDTANQVSFTVESEDLEFNTVGINDEPDQTGAVSDMNDGGNGGNGGNGGGDSVSTDVAFVDSTSGTLKTVRASGTITTYAAGGNVETIGSTVNLDADSATEVTFVDTNGNIKYIDSSDSSPTTLLSSVSAKKDGIAAGTWQGSQVSVFFANNNDEDGLYRKAPGRNRQLVATFPQKLRAVVGIGDIDDDESDEIVAITNGQKLALLDEDGTTDIYNEQPQSSTGLAIGGVADYNNNGQARVAMIDGSNNPRLVGCKETGQGPKCGGGGTGTTTLSSAGQAKKAPLGKGDIDGDGQPELVYPENIDSPAELYGVSVSGDTVSDEAHITRSDGTRIEVVVAKGVSE